jgi:hypothetical protein
LIVAHRMLLLRAGDKVSERAVHRLDRVFAHARTDLDISDTAYDLRGITVVAADLPEARRLWETINDW